MCTEVGLLWGNCQTCSLLRSLSDAPFPPKQTPSHLPTFQAHFSNSPGFWSPPVVWPAPLRTPHPHPGRRAPEDMGYRPCGDTSSAGGCPGSSRRRPPGPAPDTAALPPRSPRCPGPFPPTPAPAVPWLPTGR